MIEREPADVDPRARALSKIGFTCSDDEGAGGGVAGGGEPGEEEPAPVGPRVLEEALEEQELGSRADAATDRLRSRSRSGAALLAAASISRRREGGSRGAR